MNNVIFNLQIQPYLHARLQACHHQVLWFYNPHIYLLIIFILMYTATQSNGQDKTGLSAAVATAITVATITLLH